MPEKIVYQNKDIEFKILSESYREKSFEAYGLKMARIKEILPTNLPEVTADEMRMDNLFLLEDGTYVIVDYESENRTKNRIKYMNYISRTVKRLYKETGKTPVVRMAVIYTGDVERAKGVFQTGCMTLRMDQVFVRRLVTERIYRKAASKLRNGEDLTEQEMMRLIILPLAEKGPEKKQERIEQVIKLAKQIEKEEDQKFVLSGLLVVTNKFISKESAECIRREMAMTKVGRMIFEEGREEGKEIGMEEGRKAGREKGREEERRIAVINLLKLQIPEERILDMYSREDLEAAKAQMAITS